MNVLADICEGFGYFSQSISFFAEVLALASVDVVRCQDEDQMEKHANTDTSP